MQYCPRSAMPALLKVGFQTKSLSHSWSNGLPFRAVNTKSSEEAEFELPRDVRALGECPERKSISRCPVFGSASNPPIRGILPL
jgi:hypothetical protein